jgi:hypothetical protein
MDFELQKVVMHILKFFISIYDCLKIPTKKISLYTIILVIYYQFFLKVAHLLCAYTLVINMHIVCVSHPSTLHSRFKLMKIFSLQIECYMISLIFYFESCFVICSILHIEFQIFPALNNPKP